jgi:hypothetical protein
MTALGERLGPLVWAAGLVLLAHVPAVTAHLPILGFFAGRFAFVVIGLAAATAAASFVPMEAVARAGAPWLFAASALLSAGMGLHYVAHLQASGDEPDYLLMAQSLWKEHDLDLADNWERGDFREYVPGMPRMPSGSTRRDGRSISSHSPGLPFLLAPIYALGGRRLCVVGFALVASALSLAVRALALRATGSPTAAGAAWAATAGPPVLFYSFHLYTELPSALIAAAVLLLLTPAAGDDRSSRPGAGAAVAAALLIAVLPWLHVKVTLAAVALGVVALARLRGRPLAAFVATAAVMAAAFVAYNFHVFGTPTSMGLYGPKVPVAVRYAVPGQAFVGLLIDRCFGLLPYAPVWLLSLAGLLVLMRRPWRETWPFYAYAIAVIVPVLAWRIWFAGFCPPARFLVPLVPVLGVALAVRLAGRRYGLARWTVPLLLLGYVFTAIAVRVPNLLYLLHAKQDLPRMFEWLSGADLVLRYLPSLTYPGPAEARVAAVWCAVLVLLLLLDRLAERHKVVDRMFQSPALAVAMLVTAGFLVDTWARAPEAPVVTHGSIPRLAAGA